MKKIFNFHILSIAIVVLFFSAYSHQSLKLYFSHRTRGDLTNFAQAMWNTSHGRIMQNTFNYSVHNFWGGRETNIPTNSNIFGIHFNPILFLIVPFYILFPVPQTLLIFQSALTAAGGYIVFLISKYKLKNSYLSIIIQILFLTYFTLISAVLSEFHAVTLSIFFGLLLINFHETNKPIHYFICLLLFLFVQENTGIVTFFFGLYLLLSSKTFKKGLLTSSISLIYFLLVIKIFIPTLSNYHGYIFESIYGNPLGTTFASIIINSIKNPVLFIQSILTSQNITYLSKLFLPIFPFFIFSPLITLVGISGLTANLLSTDFILKSTSMHYEALSVPFFIYAVILGINKVNKNVTVVIGVILIIFTYLGYKNFTSLKLNYHLVLTSIYTPIDQELDDLIKSIPENASVSTQDYISGHLSNRQQLYLFPVYYHQVKYLLLGINQNFWPLTEKEQFTYINELKSNSNFKIISETKNYILFEKINL